MKTIYAQGKRPWDDLIAEIKAAGIVAIGPYHFNEYQITLHGNFSPEQEATIKSIIAKHHSDWQIIVQDTETLRQKIEEFDKKLATLADGEEKNELKMRREDVQSQLDQILKYEQRYTPGARALI